MQYTDDAHDNRVIDAETGDDVLPEEVELSETDCKKKLSALRAKLTACQKERDENLSGWQRAKADIINTRRMATEDVATSSARGKADMLRALLPGLDSFEQARSSTTWSTLPEEWRKGMERVFAQLEKGFAEQSVERFGMHGEHFDPQVHECMGVLSTEKEEDDHVVAQVLQQGYTIGAIIVRPAKVIVYEKPVN